MLASFIDAGLVSGICLRDHVGMPSDFANLTITVAGRDRLAQVEKELERGTSLGYVKHYRPKIIAWFFGILALVLVAWLVKNYIK